MKPRGAGKRPLLAAPPGQLYGHLGLRHLFLGFLSSRLPAPEREGPWPQASWLSLNPDRTVNTGKQEEVFGRADDK